MSDELLKTAAKRSVDDLIRVWETPRTDAVSPGTIFECFFVALETAKNQNETERFLNFAFMDNGWLVDYFVLGKDGIVRPMFERYEKDLKADPEIQKFLTRFEKIDEMHELRTAINSMMRPPGK